MLGALIILAVVVVCLVVTLWPYEPTIEERRRIGSTYVAGYWVSTVDLMTDMLGGWRYETMVFQVAPDGGMSTFSEDRYAQRYQTRLEAAIGHQQIVEEIAVIERAY